MPFTTVSIALNAATGVAVWVSDISLSAQVVITVLLIAKCALLFYSAWMSESERFQKVGVSLCIIANVALVAYGLFSAAYHIVMTSVVMLLVLLMWSFATVYGFMFKKQVEN